MEVTTMYLLSFLIVTVSGELIKLQDENQILCITDNPDAAISVLPPVIESNRNTSILLDNDETWKDWTLETSTNLVLPPVLDKRFEDFETFYGNQIYRPKLRSMSISVYSTSIDIIISDVPTKKKLIRKAENILFGWITQTTYPTNKISEFQLIATTPSQTYWKIHNYIVRSSTNITEKTNSITMTDQITCLVVYLYLCPTCKLTITAPGGEYSFHGYSDDMWKWDKQVVNASSGAKIKFTRATDDEKTLGQWVVDIRKCPETVSTKSIYKVSLDKEIDKETNRSCYLNALVEQSKDIFACSEVGVLGDTCDIKCEDFLGNNTKSCEKNKICDDSYLDNICYCAWGYKGVSCNQTCEAAKYGLSCEKSCGCDKCDAKTGQCPNASTSHFAMTTVVILLTMLLLLK